MQIKLNPNNPRFIKDNKLQKLVSSISDFPKIYFKDSIQICKKCGKEFKDKQHRKYCSRECYWQSLKIYKPCKMCGKDIPHNNGVRKNRVYCSVDCQRSARRGVPLSESWKKSLSLGRISSPKCHGSSMYNWKGGSETLNIRNKIYAHKRRSVLKVALDPIFLTCLVVAQKNKCFYCNEDISKYKAIEHLTPLSLGGDNWKYNLVYSCKSCNSKKRNKTLENWSISTNRPWLCDKWEYIYTTALVLQDKINDKYAI